MPDTPRAGLRRPEDADPFNIAADQRQNVDILDKAAFDSQGTFALRPLATAVKSGTYYFATDAGVVYRSDGTVWSVVGKRPALDITATELADEIVNEEKLTDGVLSKLGLTDTEAVRRGKSIVATTEARSNTAFGLMTTPDRVQGITLPADGLISVAFQAIWQESVANAATAAIFIGPNELVINSAQNTAPSTGFASQATLGGTAGRDSVLATYPMGLSGWDGQGAMASGNSGDATTGQALGGGAKLGTGSNAKAGGICTIFAAAGTYDISIQFKASSGSVTAKNRKLWVWTTSF
ncbi:MAG: hypothetical protein JHC87_08875 [Thermoleophilaceae bacterium]|nr:hypothetical protein [Thermoleophilaceae bacterium]